MTTDFPLRTWWIDDEQRNARYRFRPVFELVDTLDEDVLEGDAGGWALVDVVVVGAEEFDDRGETLRSWEEPESRRFDERAWRLIQQDAAFRKQLETRLGRVPRPAPVVSTSSAAETLAKLRKMRQKGGDHEQADRKIG